MKTSIAHRRTNTKVWKSSHHWRLSAFLCLGIFILTVLNPPTGGAQTTVSKIEAGKRLLDQFSIELAMPDKLALLPAINTHCDHAKLPSEVKYLLALHLLRGHMDWHLAYASPSARNGVAYNKDWHRRENATQLTEWQEAHMGEEWMLTSETRNEAMKEAEKREAAQLKLAHPDEQKVPAILPSSYFWQITDPVHQDVQHAKTLLEELRDDKSFGGKSRRWLAELKRNNTVLTFDVCGSYLKNKPAPVIIDARCADQLTLKLYRVHDPKPLLAVAEHIGTDLNGAKIRAIMDEIMGSV